MSCEQAPADVGQRSSGSALTTRLSTVAAGTDMLEVARAYEELAAIAEELANAVLRADRAGGPQARAGRSAAWPDWRLAGLRVRLGAGMELLVPSQIDGWR